MSRNSRRHRRSEKSKTQRLEQGNAELLQSQEKISTEIESDPIQNNTSYIQTVSDHIQSTLASIVKGSEYCASSVRQAMQSHPLLTTAGITLLTAAIVEAINAYSVDRLPAGVPSECIRTDIILDLFDTPQCETYGVYELVNGTQQLVGQLYDQLTGSRQLFAGSADCLVSKCQPDTAMSEVYGECIEETMKSVLESVLATAERLGNPILDTYAGAQKCVVNMPDWRIAETKNGQSVYNVLVSAVQVFGPKLLPDICTRFQVAMLGKENECKDTTALFLENAKRTAIIIGAVVGAAVGAAIIGGGAYLGYKKVQAEGCTLPNCGGEDGMMRRALRGIGAGLGTCFRACAAPFVACYEWATNRGDRSTAQPAQSVAMEQMTDRHNRDDFDVVVQSPGVHVSYGGELEEPAPHTTQPQFVEDVSGLKLSSTV